MDFELWTIDSSKSSNLQTTAGGPNDEQAELQLKELEAEDLWPVLNEEDKKREKQMGDNKEFEVKAQTRKQGGNGTIQQMATESRSGQKKQKNKKCPKRQPRWCTLKLFRNELKDSQQIVAVDSCMSH